MECHISHLSIISSLASIPGGRLNGWVELVAAVAEADAVGTVVTTAGSSSATDALPKRDENRNFYSAH